jgi:HD-GYP domain-containing protein (c-di-GMP phosphodiesterase class II)
MRLGQDATAEVMRKLETGEAGVSLTDEEGLDRVAEAFAGVIDAKSPYTARHSVGVAGYAVAAGERLGLGPVALRSLRRAGLLHDIGKLGVSNLILDKAGPLTDAEFAEVRRHPLYTEQILKRIPPFADIAVAAAGHHERIDGRGYHRGIRADLLPLEARILAVADVYEALTADRPYRGPMAREDALRVLWMQAGTAVAGDCVAALQEATADDLLTP